ncbi:MAG TPA: PA14 domain-containing protein, partial [bacterium]|nr:PA14 domain-containing protein [bacterium]
LLTLRLFYVLLSLASFPFLYAFLRRLAEPRVAMAALFFLAVMRWNWDEARSAQPGIEAPLFLLAMLLFFLNGVQNRSPFSLVAAAIVASLGFYAYQSLKVLSLLLWALMAFERGRFPDNWRFPRWISWLASLLPLLFALPLFHYLWVHHTLGKRESESFILGKILQSHSLFPLFSSISGMALMFNREGTSNPLHNLPGMRLLDDGTGVLFLLGLALAWKMRKERAGAYPLIGSVVMSLPGWLTFEPVPSHRYTGLMPFVVYFAALGGVGLYDAIRPAMKKNKVFLWGLVAVVLGAIAGQNAHTYFGLEASNLQCQEAAGPEQTYIGRQIGQLEKEAPGRYRFFLDPFFQHNPTVAFLGYSAADRTAPFEVSDWAKGKMPRDKDSAVFLAQDKSGVWFFLKTLFPHDVDGVFRGPDGQVDLFWDRVPVSDLQEMKEWRKGLEGIYIQSGLWTDPPMGSRLDPVINFASREDFPFDAPPPYRARWSGRLQIKTSGNYQFIVLSTDSAQLWL